jgi:hypothetical protein
MKKLLLSLAITIPFCFYGQIGIKGGLNFANVTKASSINSSSRTGFMAGIFMAPPSTGVMGFRTELIYSKQGYNYKTSTNTGNVNLDYIILPQLMCINLTKFVQLQFGGQMAFLLNAKVDSSNGTDNSTGSQAMDAYNKFDYGYAIGGEIHPFKGLIIGARYNVSLGDMYKNMDYTTGAMPSFIPKVDTKNNVVQLFIGWTFGKQPKKQGK